MQPVNIKPAARIPNFNFSDDMVYFRSKDFASARQLCAQNATIPLSLLSSKSVIIPDLRWLSRAATGPLCLFCRKFLAPGLIFGQAGLGCRIRATPKPFSRHKYGPAVNLEATKRLPESS